MKKVLPVLFIFFFLCMASNARTNPAPRADVSGIDCFWEIQDLLSRDIDPPAETWDRLFQSPGYAALIESTEFSPEHFITQFSLAYRPSWKSRQDAALQKKSFFTPYLRHLMEVPARKKELQAYAHQLENNPDLLKRSMEITANYLPEHCLEKFDPPAVSFVFFGPDSRAYSVMTIDLLHAMEHQDQLCIHLAHEFHHHYVNQMRIPLDKDDPLVWMVDQVQKEGLADQIDKPVFFLAGGSKESTAAAVKYRKYVQESPSLIIKIDSLVQVVCDNPERAREEGRGIYRILPQSGHHPGFFMAGAIRDMLGEEMLFRDPGNPYLFFYRYQEAALRDPGKYPPFSASTLNYLKKLEGTSFRP